MPAVKYQAKNMYKEVYRHEILTSLTDESFGRLPAVTHWIKGWVRPTAGMDFVLEGVNGESI
jgi:hypothetical protein